jgi:Fe-S-cluster containining protein
MTNAKTQRRQIEIAATRESQGSQDACVDCPALCCHDLTTPIDRPRKREDIDDLRWYLHYTHVHVAIVRRQWHIVYEGRCRYLDDDNLCTIYETRPEKCRTHGPPVCEKFNVWYDYWIDTPEELEDYLKGDRERFRRESPHCSRGRLLGKTKRKRLGPKGIKR